MANFTAGNWKLRVTGCKYQIVKEDNPKALIATVGSMQASPIPTSEHRANVTLILHAAEVFKALKYARRFVDENEVDTDYLDRVINHAEGNSNG